MGGTIEVESTTDKGSCFRVELPVERTEECEARPAGRDRVLGLEPGQPEYRILMVEDQPENWMVLERLLRKRVFKSAWRRMAKQGVESFREWRPQFIWMDLRMPVMDGIEATRRIRALDGGRDVKIVAVTASGFESQRSEVLAAGLDDYVRKPYRLDEIFDCMDVTWVFGTAELKRRRSRLVSSPWLYLWTRSLRCRKRCAWNSAMPS